MIFLLFLWALASEYGIDESYVKHSAGNCAVRPGTATNVTDYYFALIDVLAELEEGQKALNKVNAKMPPAQLFVAFKKNGENITCGLKKLDAFSSSKNKAISESAAKLYAVLASIRNHQDNRMNRIKNFMNGDKASEQAGTAAVRDAEQEMVIENAWKAVPETYALAMQARGSVSKVDRKRLVKELQKRGLKNPSAG